MTDDLIKKIYNLIDRAERGVLNSAEARLLREYVRELEKR